MSAANAKVGTDNVPVGCISAIPGDGQPNPKYWVACDGASLERTGAFAALFGACGTIWGLSDSDHFNLPDMRGMFLRGTDFSGNGVDPDRNNRVANNPGGSIAGTGSQQGWATASRPNRNIPISIPQSYGPNPAGGRNSVEFSPWNGREEHFSVDGGDSETRPINLAVRFYIKYAEATYVPSRSLIPLNPKK
jgi:hypothetical protein